MLTCASCGTANPAGHRFCGGCGSSLAAVCPACGTTAGAGFTFCGACGAALAGAPPAVPTPTSERRVCSVLFADLVGFTPLSESRDHEDVRALLSRYFDTARTVIGRYGGTVEKFIGDAVMAVWGTPTASEGDAERAVRAGLDLVAAVTALGAEIGSQELALRAGVVTGEVTASIGAVGEGMVAGDAVNTAARVQGAAAPGTVWVDTATQRLALTTIGFADEGEHRLKGKSEPARLWRATRVLSSVGGTQRVDGLEAPMVGRVAEERTLRELFHATAERRTPRLVTVAGPAGSGKSRLGWEFEKYIDGLAGGVLWHRGRCLSYGDGVAYWALAEAVRQRLGISAEDPADDAVDKLVGALPTWLPAPEECSFVGVRLGRLLGLRHPDDRGASLAQDELFAGWRVFLERLADEDPVVMLVEDAQHADEALLDFVEHVVEWSRQSPIYLVLLGRSELLERRQSLAVGRNRTALPLDELDQRSMRALVAELVADLPEDAITRIVDQAQGNPLFAVETVRSLIDRDVIVPVEGVYRLTGDLGTLTVPDSLHGLLAARLDALDPALRSLVADAAVLGTSFPAQALAAVSSATGAEVTAGLAELVHRDVLTVSTDPFSPEQGSYVFTQGMLRQVAYDTLSRRDRRARHLAVAEHLQRVFTDGGEEVMDVVAQHYLDALAAIADPDDDAVRRRARDSLVRAAERSERAGALVRAAGSYERAAEITAVTDLLAAAGLWERAGNGYGWAARGHEAIAVLERAIGVYRDAGRARDAARATAEKARWLRRAGRGFEAKAQLSVALNDLRPDPDADTVAALDVMAGTSAMLGEVESRGFVDEALGLMQALDLPDTIMARLIATRGLSNMIALRTREAGYDLRLAVQLADTVGDRRTRLMALTNLASILLGSDFAAAAATARLALEDAQLVGDPVNVAVAYANLALALLSSGDWAEARDQVAAAESVTVAAIDYLGFLRPLLDALIGRPDEAVLTSELLQHEEPETAAIAAWVGATTAVALGDPGRALTLLRPHVSDGTGFQLQLQLEAVYWSWPIAVRCAFELGDVGEARRLVALLGASPAGHLAGIARSNLALARARLAALDAEAGADALFDAAIADLRSTGSPFHLAHGLLDRAEHDTAAGRDAAALIAEAAAIAERLGAVEITRRLVALDVPVGG